MARKSDALANGAAPAVADLVDRIPSLKVRAGMNTQQASKLLRAARVELYARMAKGRRPLRAG
jgi:hypothetical protein